MTQRSFTPESSTHARGMRINRFAPTMALSPIEQRLDRAERELRVQFVRIAQLQAELDLVLAALRRSAGNGHERHELTHATAAR